MSIQVKKIENVVDGPDLPTTNKICTDNPDLKYRGGLQIKTETKGWLMCSSSGNETLLVR